VLKAYEAVRIPRASSIALRSKMAGDTYEGHGASGSSEKDMLKDIELQWEQVWHHDIELEIRAAIHALVNGGSFTDPVANFAP
jgi:hypothetical protein